MELGAGVELATAAVPHLFLPLACAANVVKVFVIITRNRCVLQNLSLFALLCIVYDYCLVSYIVALQNVAAVTSTSTRTPIYKAFAKGENIGDVTAKGECVGNIADLV